VKTLFLFVAMLMVGAITSPGNEIPECLRKAIRMAESGDNEHVRPGDNGNAQGVYQMWQPYVDDANHVLRTRYTNTDCIGNRELAETIFTAYMSRYATAGRLGHKPTAEDIARIHNGGPYGCFDNGAINKDGALMKDPVRRAKLAQVQKNAKKYYETRVKPHLKGECTPAQ